MSRPSPPRPFTRSHAASTSVERVVEAAALLRDGKQVVILHRGERYRLSETRSGKLILTK